MRLHVMERQRDSRAAAAAILQPKAAIAAQAARGPDICSHVGDYPS